MDARLRHLLGCAQHRAGDGQAVFARSKSLGRVWFDDVCLFCGWVFSVMFTATACISVWDYDIGRHVWDVRPDRYQGALYWAWIAQVMFIWSTGFTKMSVLLFYRRMVKDTYSKMWTYAVWVLSFITIGSIVSLFVAYCFICTPLHAYWDIHQMMDHPDSYHCLDGDAMTIAAGVLTIASDFWTAALPCAMFQVHDLGVSRRQKIALNIIFCLGFIVTGVGIARTYYLWIIGHDMDLSWVGYDLFVTSIVELQLSLICTCAPFCRAFFRRYFPDLTHRSRSGTGNSFRGGGGDNANTNSSNSNNKSVYSSTTTANRASVAPSTIRGSYVQPLKPIFEKGGATARGGDEELINLEAQEEKTGFLVREESSGRLVWSGRATRMSSLLSTEPTEYT